MSVFFALPILVLLMLFTGVTFGPPKDMAAEIKMNNTDLPIPLHLVNLWVWWSSVLLQLCVSFDCSVLMLLANDVMLMAPKHWAEIQTPTSIWRSCHSLSAKCLTDPQSFNTFISKAPSFSNKKCMGSLYLSATAPEL